MKDKTRDNAYKAFVGEAKAYFRLLAYSEQAKKEGLTQIALLFKAIADAERVHATKNLLLLKDVLIEDTDTNLEKSFAREKSVSDNEYPNFIKDAVDEKEEVAAKFFRYAKDAEDAHAKLYERAIYNLIKDIVKEYYVCQVCGYVTDKKIKDKCPICNASKENFNIIKDSK